MKKWWMVVLVLSCVLFSTHSAFSQIELFGGYSYLHVNNTPPGMGSSANGWEASLAAHLLGPLGAELDFSNHYGMTPTIAPNGTRHFVPEFTGLYGPQFTIFSLPHIEPFVHALLGSVHGVADVPSPALPPCSIRAGCPTVTLRQSAFAMAFGGGINVKATHHVWIRLIQADYLRFNFSSNPQNDTRISTGLVFRFGSW